jgi:glucose/arabinose dehydrogenase
MRSCSLSLSAAIAVCLLSGCKSGQGAGGQGGTDDGSGGGAASGTGGSTNPGTGGGAVAPPSNSCDNVPAASRIAAFTADAHFCLIRYAQDVAGARQLAFAPNGDLFVAGGGRIVVLYDTDGNGVSDTGERSTFASMQGANHGLAITATHIYASSPSTVSRWTYAPGQRVSTGTAETVVRGIGAGGHSTRTLLVDGQNRLYVSIGSAGNVDAPATAATVTRALIRRYDLNAIPAGGYAVAAGELFAYGLRNEVGLSFDSQGRLWGVENSRDNLLGNDHFDNPAEEVNLFDATRPGRNYGYPTCWSEGIWTGAAARGPGTQHLDPDQPGGLTEAACQDATAIVPPAYALRAHLAPLDIVEYMGAAYPSEFRGNLFVTSHGSWNRENGQVGRLIVRIRPGNPGQIDNFLGEVGPAGGLREGAWAVRPVSIRVDSSGLLTFTDDATGTVHKIGYRP